METNQEARLRLFLAEYERLCKRYSLFVDGAVFERHDLDHDDLPQHIEGLRIHGIVR